MSEFAGKHITIIVEDGSVPFDTRVWREANTLKDNGADVSIICPRVGEEDKYENINGINIYRHPIYQGEESKISYLFEYTVALFWEFVFLTRISLKKKIDVIQGCSPPDLIFIPVLPFKLLGTKYVFDHHDVSPELLMAKYQGATGIFYKMLLGFEKLSFKFADISLATNQSYKNIAIERGGMSENCVEIVRNGPDLNRMQITKGDNKYKNGRQYLVGYLGNIGAQEGLDLLLQCARQIKDERSDIQFAIIGSGPFLEKAKAISSKLDVEDIVKFYGRVSNEKMLEILNTCDVCVNPDKPSKMNDISTMNKIMEYMALKKPIVQFDMKEGRVSAGESSLYAKDDVQDFKDKIILLLEDEDKRKEMGEIGYDRVVNKLSWEIQSENLVKAYKKLL